MKLGIDTSALQRFARKIGLKDNDIRIACARGVTRGALMVQGTAQAKILKGPKTGRLYGDEADIQKYEAAVVGGTEKQRKAAGKHVHQASAPGEAPANDTGHLARSIFIVQATPGIWNTQTAWVKTRNKYANALEYGTKWIEPRPFMHPSLNENRGRIAEAVQEEIQKALGEGGGHAG